MCNDAVHRGEGGVTPKNRCHQLTAVAPVGDGQTKVGPFGVASFQAVQVIALAIKGAGFEHRIGVDQGLVANIVSGLTAPLGDLWKGINEVLGDHRNGLGTDEVLLVSGRALDLVAVVAQIGIVEAGTTDEVGVEVPGLGLLVHFGDEFGIITTSYRFAKRDGGRVRGRNQRGLVELLNRVLFAAVDFKRAQRVVFAHLDELLIHADLIRPLELVLFDRLGG